MGYIYEHACLYFGHAHSWDDSLKDISSYLGYNLQDKPRVKYCKLIEHTELLAHSWNDSLQDISSYLGYNLQYKPQI